MTLNDRNTQLYPIQLFSGACANMTDRRTDRQAYLDDNSPRYAALLQSRGTNRDSRPIARKRCNIWRYLQRKTNRNSYAIYCMMLYPMTLSDLLRSRHQRQKCIGVNTNKLLFVARCYHLANDLTNFTDDRRTHEQTNIQTEGHRHRVNSHTCERSLIIRKQYKMAH